MINAKRSALRVLKSPYLALTLIMLVSFPTFFLRGFGVFDDSVYLKIGELISDGWQPYRDVFDNKPPGIYYLAALLAWAGGQHWLTSRIFLFCFAILTGWLAIKYAKQNWGAIAGYLVAYLFGISYVLSQGYSYLTEQFCAFFGFLAIWIISGDSARRKGNWIGAGICISLAFLFKQVAALYLMAFLLSILILILARKIELKTALNRSLLLLIGFAGISLTILFSIYTKGLWTDFYHSIFLSLEGFSDYKINLVNILKFWIQVPVFPVFLILGLILFFNKTICSTILESRSFPEFLFLFTSGVLSILPTLKVNGNTHYAGTIILALGIAEASVFSHLWQHIAKSKLKLFALKLTKKHLAISFILLLGFYSMGLLWLSLRMASQNRIAADVAQMKEIRSIFDQCAAPNVPVLTVSSIAPRLNYMSGRPPFTKYLYFFWNTEVSLQEASQLLNRGEAPLALVDVAASNPDQQDNKPSSLIQKTYIALDLKSPSPAHLKNWRTEILINRQFEKNCSFD